MPRGNFKGKHSTRAQKVEFVRREGALPDHDLARAMRGAGLYSLCMGVTDIAMRIPLLRSEAAQDDLPLAMPDLDADTMTEAPAGPALARHLRHALVGYRDWVRSRVDVRRYPPGTSEGASWRAGMEMAKRDLAGRRAA